jgi:uncharacterized protein (DUF1499 family)
LLKIIISVLFLFIVLVIGRLLFLSMTSKAPDANLLNGILRPCPQTPNCISSEDDESLYKIDPLSFNSSSEQAWKDLKTAIGESGGKTRHFDETYLWATYTSKVFRFVDDMEFRLVAEKKIIQIRSGSRVGHSDLGVNRKNVERLRKQFDLISTSTQ